MLQIVLLRKYEFKVWRIDHLLHMKTPYSGKADISCKKVKLIIQKETKDKLHKLLIEEI